jgi:hypothetical protein
MRVNAHVFGGKKMRLLGASIFTPLFMGCSIYFLWITRSLSNV